MIILYIMFPKHSLFFSNLNKGISEYFALQILEYFQKQQVPLWTLVVSGSHLWLGTPLLTQAEWTSAFESETNSLIKSLDRFDLPVFLSLTALT